MMSNFPREHARELISAESGLHFAKTLCDSDKARAELQRSEFLLVVNANPGSRVQVEQIEGLFVHLPHAR
ncbi:hypothetical protein AK812_SmicGene27537 [Symbiodinium microadriaticum]|uniref:Uncharacterized protein n=1 Tax=Symbiodinium microadriaticum TaxID=2951 RepID=A0A1Q9D6V2_SYMMI|nr:hypothetical protein AK812_SmicGene27537 [Symbiodinium microadriaticum]